MTAEDTSGGQRRRADGPCSLVCDPAARLSLMLRRAVAGVLATVLCVAVAVAAPDQLREGMAAAEARNYVRAAEIFLPLAVAGNPSAQAYLAHMYANGQGVPQNFMVSAGWYRCAADQGFANAQYMLGVMYDRGQGVPQDYVMAYVWLNLAVAGAGPEREHWALVRDAIRSKLTLLERQTAQTLAFTGPPPRPCLPIEVGY